MILKNIVCHFGLFLRIIRSDAHYECEAVHIVKKLPH